LRLMLRSESSTPLSIHEILGLVPATISNYVYLVLVLVSVPSS
jgi:hypothetical protein